MASQAPSQAPRERSSPTEQTPSSTNYEASTTQQITYSQPEPDLISSNNVLQIAASPPVADSTSLPIIQSTTESRRCWICQQDDTDDRPEDGEWRRPCPCSLTAHDSCLLDYIADQEAPKSGDLVPQVAISCPQCKATWIIQRPQDPILKAYGAVQQFVDSMKVPVIVSTSLGFLYSGCLVYGLNSICMVFGRSEAVALLGGPIRLGRYDNSFKSLFTRSLHILEPFLPTTLWAYNYNLLLSLPLVAPSLILLRTNFADQASAVILPIYFLKHQKTHPNFNLTWPPSPGLIFATMPFIKKAYNALYKSLFSSLEKKWDLAVQRKPREGETAEEIQNQNPDGEAELIFNVEWGREEFEVPAANADIGAAVEEADAGQEGQDGGIENANPDADPNAGPMRHVDNWNLRRNIPPAPIASTVLGALAFPTISSTIGDLLKLALPTEWTGGFGRGGFAGGFLRQKWARSVVGGCLFVVLKDAVTLYCKWRKAKNFGKRRVLDWDKREMLRHN
ncbi:uncharacterized protein RSE6_01831 [Rhynchosporium secalis]|uniref:RING-CH-type domain-containing protein n=1 Tax=Rhynchosporium secalis TaxID=38038 RepID=A0A1E1M0E7_RHYSE|nr:uncharacterized protein RSE6_01831 [Rhynchosporium secalis]